MFQRLAVALDETDQSQRAFRVAADLSKRLNPSLLTGTVKELLPAYTAFATIADPTVIRSLEDDHTRFYEQLVANAAASAAGDGAVLESVLLDGRRWPRSLIFLRRKTLICLLPVCTSGRFESLRFGAPYILSPRNPRATCLESADSSQLANS